jgi:AraC-like DNA-binding protein
VAGQLLFNELEALRARTVVHVRDPNEMDSRSLVSHRFPEASRDYKYRLRDSALMRTHFNVPIFRFAIGWVGDILVSRGADRFATEIAIEGDRTSSLYCFNMLLRGDLTVVRGGTISTASGDSGLAMRAEAGVRYLTSDLNARANMFLRASDLEDALTRMLDDRMRNSLDFRPLVHWGSGLAASVRFQFDVLLRELNRPNGLASNPIAVASMTDLLLTLVLQGVPHNYSDRLEARRSGGSPSYLRRAEDFMRANAASPIQMAQVADAAGCSVRTLSDVFRQFRGTTPLKALHGIRLEFVRDALSDGAAEAPWAVIANRYGFTNAGRFARAYRRRFGEAAAQTARVAGLTGVSTRDLDPPSIS